METVNGIYLPWMGVEKRPFGKFFVAERKH